MFSRCLLGAYSVPGRIGGTRDVAVNKQKVLSLKDETDNKQTQQLTHQWQIPISEEKAYGVVRETEREELGAGSISGISRSLSKETAIEARPERIKEPDV